MGEWEADSQIRCDDCGATLHSRRSRHRVDSPRMSQPLHYYVVNGRKLCPACWTTTRIAPSVIGAA
jgi:hypothetical protein